MGRTYRMKVCVDHDRMAQIRLPDDIQPGEHEMEISMDQLRDREYPPPNMSDWYSELIYDRDDLWGR